jgi:putative ABC transport system permease protein
VTRRWTVPADELRSVTAAALTLTLRRARRDVLLLTAWGLLVAFVAMLAVAAPRQLIDTVDRGAQQAVATAGSRADLVISVRLGTSAGGTGAVLAPQRVPAFTALITQGLPPVISRVSAGTTTTVLGPITNVATIGGTKTAANIQLQIGMLTPGNRAGLHVTSGELPGPFRPGGSIPVAISAADARALGAKVGSAIGVAMNAGFGEAHDGDPIPLHVVGIIAQAPGGTADWLDTSGLWAPTHPPSVQLPSPIEVTVLTTPPGVTTAQSRYADAFSAQLRVRLAPSRFSGETEPKVAAAIGALKADATRLTGGTGVDATVNSDFDDALASYPTQSRAAAAQMSLVLASLLGAAVAVLILLSQLLVHRRGNEIALERARGAELTAIAFRTSLESMVVAATACALGFIAAQVALPGPFDDPVLFAVAVVIAIVAGPAQSVLLVRREWSHRQAPANRRDRQEIERRSRSTRLVAEAIVLAIAIAALVSLASRGLLETRTSGIDPFLASAPVLCAIATTLLILRVYRVPVRALASGMRRSRGVVGLLAAARAENAVAALPLLALTLAATLAIGGSVLIATVNDGQVTASWQRIGADVRVEARVSTTGAAELASRPGISAVATVHVGKDVLAQIGGRPESPTLLAIDQGFSSLVSQLPANAMGGSNVTSLRNLGQPVSPGGALPVVVDAQLGKVLVTRDISIYYGDGNIELHVVGVTSVEPNGFLQGPFLYVDRAALAKRLASPTATGKLPASQIAALTTPNEVLILGPDALRAARSLGFAASATLDRGSWLSSRRHLALVTGTQQTMLLATIAVALLAAIALIATALAGARERGRALSLLRTLGLRAALGWWLALADLLPIVVAAILGGIVAGVGIVDVLEPTLGLSVLAGGQSNPAAVVSPLLLVGLSAATVLLLGVAVLAEVAAHRRDRLSEVLRVGDTV